jgi:hypothetical protein
MIGPTNMTYEGGYILSKHLDEDRKLKHGTGVMGWEDGREYRGQFAFDKMHGEGSMTWPNGAKYMGQYCDNLKSGLGKLTQPDGCSFEGNWHKGRRDGDFLFCDPQHGTFRMEYEADLIIKTERVPGFDVSQYSASLASVGWTFKPGYDVFIKEAADAEDKEGECSEEVTCCICLGELCAGDTCGEMPCKHQFHKECIDSWTKRRNQCPLCLQKVPSYRLCNESHGTSPSTSEPVHL